MKACIIDPQISRMTTIAAATMAALLAVVLPAGFYHFSFQHHAGSIQAKADYYGYVVSQGVRRQLGLDSLDAVPTERSPFGSRSHVSFLGSHSCSACRNHLAFLTGARRFGPQ